MRSEEEIRTRHNDIIETIHKVDMDIECGGVVATDCMEHMQYQNELENRLHELEWVLGLIEQ